LADDECLIARGDRRVRSPDRILEAATRQESFRRSSQMIKRYFAQVAGKTVPIPYYLTSLARSVTEIRKIFEKLFRFSVTGILAHLLRGQ